MLPTEAVQDYLKTIYTLQENHEPAAPSTVAARLGVTRPSVSAMLKKLAGQKLVRHAPYGMIALTPAGQRFALEVVRHHRILETYLVHALGYSWDAVHAEADRLEHALSEDLEERMFERLGRPTRDPHGHPIPSRDGRLRGAVSTALADFPVGVPAAIARVSDRDPAMLRYLGARGLVPETEVMVLAKEPFGGPITVRSRRAAHLLGPELAQHIRVRKTTAPSEHAAGGCHETH